MKSILLKAGLPILILVVAAGAAQLIIASKKPPEQKEDDKKALLVDTLSASPQTVRFTVKAQGTVRPKVETDLISEVRGRVIEISPKFVNGGYFNKGDLLVRIEPADYQTALIAAKAEVARAKANLQEELARAKVAETDWKQFDLETAPELGLRKPQVAKEMANVAYAEAELEKANRDLERTMIRAPYDGMVYQKDVDLGQYLTVGAQIGIVYGTDVAEVRLPLSDNDLAYLELPFVMDRDSAVIPDVTLSAHIAGTKAEWSAQLRRSEKVIDEKTRLIYLVAEVDDPYGRNLANTDGYFPLKFGRFVQADIAGQRAENIYVFPRHVLRRGNQILLVDSENHLRLRDVEVLRTDGDSVYISAGIEDGEQVALTPISNPLDGMAVRTIPPSLPGPQGLESEPEQIAIANDGDTQE
ncbi:efflux RND transporter periplasmic adaptor subunit [Corallincola platygyrae]|uniref:Efflux RND transporter periplasmic adaptor subunit n=1 Tax=Corallincola platygyrae TaxID=1193278 RepID=A0ABW4XM17_9GAMM